MKQPEFLPTTRSEMDALGWDELDVLIVSGDAYVDSHSFAAALLGRWLVEHGYRAGIAAQPAWENTDDIVKMGRPRLFAAVSAGAMDSLLAHYTAFRKKRGEDAYSPGGRTGLRPNRATLVYTGLVRQAFPGLPVAAGGIEASLRRASHYDFWSDSLRRAIVLDSKADTVLYGMGERSILDLARMLEAAPARQRPADAIMHARIKGSCYAVHPDNIPDNAEELPSHEAILSDPGLLIKSALAFEEQMLHGGPCLVQRSGGRAVVFEPPAKPLSEAEMDAVYDMPFTRRAHPGYGEPIPAVAMLEGSVASHRGCGGGCSFCSLALHQGRLVQSRSAGSIEREVKRMTESPGWKGSITDIGGPSSNMWGARCETGGKNCKRTSCLFPKKCRNFRVDQEAQAAFLRRVSGMEGVKHVRVASGVRHDLALESEEYMRALVGEFTGGQLKIAPEHISERVLRHMRKPVVGLWNQFLRDFERLSKEAGKEQYVVPYLMSAFPGCSDADMEELAAWLKVRGWRPQQVQCFIPTPGTVASAMYFAEQDVDGRPIKVVKSDAERLFQHRLLMPDAEPTLTRTARVIDPDAPRPERPDRDRFKHRPSRQYNSDSGRFAARRDGDRPPARHGGGKPGFAKPGFSKPGFSKPGFAKPGFSKPGAGKFGGKPSFGDKPSYGKPGGGKFGDKPSYGKPGGGKFGDKPPYAKPSSGSYSDKPSYGKPGGGKFGDKPSYGKPGGGKFGDKPSYGKPGGGKFGDKPSYGKPGGGKFGDKPSYGKPGGGKFGGKPGFNKPGGKPGFKKPGGHRPDGGGGRRP